MGLVNLGADMQQDHEDKEHEKHCNEKSCLMYWAVETQAAMGNIVGMNTPPDLDAQCRADIRAKGGK